MAIIKCKMCGGDLNISEDMTVAECEYCGTKQTLPKLDDQQRAAAFDRGNHFRRLGEFDKALSVYERIVQEDENDAEAHWCCALCRFGIEYVKDPASGDYLPTCHRASFDSFLEDVDYKAALAHADGVSCRQYEQDGEQIAVVQRGILATVQKEKPFDVFICYKETDEQGQRTVDSTLAQDIYYQLIEQGRRVFFSRITLEDKAGQEYEPYIFAALRSAKVMVVVGTRPEYLNAVWVKNEWSRYLALMKHDRKRLLIPCYRDMDPYDLPEQLSILQSYDMGKIGFIQDLIRGVNKVLDADKKPEVQKTVVVQSEGGGNLTALLKRGNMALEDGEWNRADEFFEQALNIDAECAEAYLGKALAVQQCGTPRKLAEKWKRMTPNQESLTACEADTARIDAMAKQYAVSFYLRPNEIKEAIPPFDFTYQSSVSGWKKLLEQENAYFTHDKLMGRAVRYASGGLAEQLTAVRKDIQTALQNSLAGARQEDEESVRQVKEKYAAHLDQAEKTVAQLSQRALERQEEDKREKEKRAQEREKQKLLGIIGGAVAAIALVIGIVVTQFIIPSVKYHNAEALLAAGDYDGAVTAFGKLGSFKDAEGRIPEVKYAQAEALLAAEDYDGAAAAFSELGSYKDAEERILEVKYAQAEALLAGGDTAGAAKTFGGVGSYQDARERSMGLWDEIARRGTIAAGGDHTVGLKANGTVVASEGEDQRNVDDWQNIVAVATGWHHTVGLRADGTVVATSSKVKYDHGQCDVNGWTDIVAIAAGDYHTVGLKADGTVVAVGVNKDGQCNVSGWRDIVAVAAGDYYTVGLKADDTVVAVGSDSDGECDVSDWTDIVTVAAGWQHTVGLKADGTVVATEYTGFIEPYHSQCDVSGWRDIVAVAAGDYHTVALKADGTVVAVGWNEYGQCDVSGWRDIVAVAAGDYHTVALKADGTVVAVGANGEGQCDVSGWSGIKIPVR